MKIYGANDKCYAIVIRSDQYMTENRSINFFTDDDDFLQVGTWTLDNNRITPPHFHHQFPRTAEITQEAVFCVEGSLLYSLFELSGEFIKEVEIKKGDIILSFYGGHSYKGLTKETRVLEFKNGPFLGVKNDKSGLKINE